MRYALVALLVLCSVSPAAAQVSIGIGLPSISIGINIPVFPELVVVPGYPVYYAPRADVNLFFYDGLYWVYQGDNWYASSWYNGPWVLYEPYFVPVFILRIPVSFYLYPPVYFAGGSPYAPPRWGEHWGREWEQRRGGWDQWDRRAAPAPAPLPVYQRQYSGERYPRVEQQAVIHNQNYRYQPQDPTARRHYQQAPPQPVERPRSSPPAPQQGSAPRSAPVPPQQQRGPEPQVNPRVQPPQGPAQREQGPKPQVQEKGPQGHAAPAQPSCEGGRPGSCLEPNPNPGPQQAPQQGHAR